MRARAAAILAELEVDLDPDMRLRDLAIAQQAPRRHRPRAVGRRQDRHHGRADRGALLQGDRGALRASSRKLKARGQGDPLHQPQVRGNLPHRRPLHRASATAARSAQGCVAEATPAELDRADGRAHRRPDLPQGAVPIGETVLAVDGLSHPTEFADISLRRCAAARSSASTAWSAPAAAR